MSSKPAAGAKRAADVLDALGLMFLALALVLGVCLQEVAEGTFRSALLASVVSGAALLLVAGALLRGRSYFRLRATDPAIVGIVVLAATSVVWAADARAATARAVELLGVAMAFFVARSLAKDRIKRCVLLAVLAATALVCVLYGYHQYFYGFDEMLRAVEQGGRGMLEIPGLTAESLPDFITRIEEREVFSFFFLSNVFGGYLLIFLSIVAAMAAAAWMARRRVDAGVLAAACVLTAGVLVLTKSKGAFLAAGAMLALFVVGIALAKRVRPRTLVFVVMGVLALGAVLGTAVLWDRQEIVDRGGSLAVRMGFVKGAIAVFKSHPITGVGAGNVGDFYFACKPLWAHEAQQAHSSFLQGLSELGLVGGGLLLLLAVTLGYELTRERSWVFREPPDKRAVRRDVAAGALGGIAAFVLLCQTFVAASAYAVVIFIAVWLAGFAGTTRLLERLREKRLQKTLYVGTALGLAAIVLHSLIDIDFEVMGLTLVVAAIAGWLTVDPDTSSGKGVVFAGVRAWVALVAALLLLGFLTLAVARPMGKAEAFLARAKAQAGQGRMGRAMALARMSVEADPSYAEAHAVLSGFHTARWQSLESESDFDAARERLERAIALNPQQSSLRRRRGDLYRLAYERDPSFFDRAVAAYEEAIERYPGDTRALLALARLIDARAQSTSGASGRDRLLSEALDYYLKFLEITKVNTNRHLTPHIEEMMRVEKRIGEITSQQAAR